MCSVHLRMGRRRFSLRNQRWSFFQLCLSGVITQIIGTHYVAFAQKLCLRGEQRQSTIWSKFRTCSTNLVLQTNGNKNPHPSQTAATQRKTAKRKLISNSLNGGFEEAEITMPDSLRRICGSHSFLCCICEMRLCPHSDVFASPPGQAVRALILCVSTLPA